MNQYGQLNITKADFAEPDLEWEPIKLDPGDAQIQELNLSLEKIIEEIRADNGYPVSHPGEHAYVLDKLKTLSARLHEEATISIAYIREFAIEPINMMLVRFANTTKEIALTGLKAAIIDAVKRYAKEGMDHIINMLR